MGSMKVNIPYIHGSVMGMVQWNDYPPSSRCLVIASIPVEVGCLAAVSAGAMTLEISRQKNILT